MADKGASTGKTFADEFLHHYLKNGIGAMSKSDIDALVMYLLDKVHPYARRRTPELFQPGGQPDIARHRHPHPQAAL